MDYRDSGCHPANSNDPPVVGTRASGIEEVFEPSCMQHLLPAAGLSASFARTGPSYAQLISLVVPQ
jgi:hypothetical protein